VVEGIHPDYARFSWATPENVLSNPYTGSARNLTSVATKLLAEYDSALE
jgi:hypothetical protein